MSMPKSNVEAQNVVNLAGSKHQGLIADLWQLLGWPIVRKPFLIGKHLTCHKADHWKTNTFLKSLFYLSSSKYWVVTELFWLPSCEVNVIGLAEAKQTFRFHFFRHFFAAILFFFRRFAHSVFFRFFRKISSKLVEVFFSDLKLFSSQKTQFVEKLRKTNCWWCSFGWKKLGCPGSVK